MTYALCLFCLAAGFAAGFVAARLPKSSAPVKRIPVKEILEPGWCHELAKVERN